MVELLSLKFNSKKLIMKAFTRAFQAKFILLQIISLMCAACVFSQAPSIQWQKTFGGTSSDMHARSIQQTLDGGFITIGTTTSTNGDITGNHGQYDIWVVKMNKTGSLEWQKTLGGSKSDQGACIQQTADSGYILTGSTQSSDGDVINNYGGMDGWIVKLDNEGNIQWQKTFGSINDDQLFSIQQTTDGGYITAGYTVLYGPVHYGKEFWVLKIDNSGNMLWQKTFGGSGDDIGYSIQQLNDGEFIVAGGSQSNNGDVTGNHGYEDVWLIKLDSEGNLIWQKSLGGTNDDFANYVQQTKEGGYIVSGASRSSDGDVTNNKGDYDYWIVKLNNSGSIQWQKNYGGSYEDEASYIKQMNDGSYIVSGYSKSYDGDIVNNHSNDNHSDYWILKLNNKGNIEWQKTLGGSKDDNAWSIATTDDNGYVISGDIQSNDGDVTNNRGQSDYWIVKLNSAILPVSLINFTAVKNTGNILLTWQTADETNSKNFIVLRSFDGIHFDSITTIAASKNTNKVTTYHYTDYASEKLNSQEIYYRLYEVNLDGTFKPSNVVSVHNNAFVIDVHATPNPFTDKLMISLSAKKQQQVEFIITDGTGKKIIDDNKKNLNEGLNKIYYNCSSWSKGIYFIKIITEDGSIKTLKIIGQ